MALKRANGTGSVYKMKHKKLRKPWRAILTVGYDDNGNAIRKSIGTFRTANEGLKALDEYVKSPSNFEQKQVTFKKCLDLYVENQQRKGVKIQTIFPTFVKRFSHLLDTPFNNITLEQWQVVFDNLNDVAYSTKSLYKTIITSVYKIAIMRDISIKNYGSFIIIKKEEQEKSLHKVLKNETLRKLWQNTSDLFVQLVLIYCYTGLRFDELLRIEKNNVQLNERYMIGGLKTKAGKDRIIPIHECIVPFIETLVKNATDTLKSGLPIHSNDGIRKNLKRVCLEFANEKITPHDFRYTFITMATNYKMDEHTLKLIVGHTQKDITNQVYIHKNTKQLINSINILPYGTDMDMMNFSNS